MSSSGYTAGPALPPEIVALAAAEGLGLPRLTFLPKRTATWRLVGQAVFAVIGLAALILPGVMFMWILSQSPNLSKKQAARRLHLFDGGLIVTDRRGAARAVRWDSTSVLQEIVRKYANGVYVGTFYKYTLTTPEGSRQGGQPVVITNFFDGPDRWGPAIQKAITEAQLPGVLAALEAGRTIQFGEIAVNAGGIATPKRSASWDEIQDVSVSRGWVYIKKAGKKLQWSNKPVKQIPNFLLFMAVIGVLTTNSRRPGTMV